MPITALDPTSALIVIDLQEGIVNAPLAHPSDEVVEQSVRLIAAFRERSLPVVLVNVAGSPPGRTDRGTVRRGQPPAGFTDLVPALDPRPSDLLITKYARSAFTGTGLAERLHALGVTQVVVTGIATSSGVESTARDAHEEGFHVTIPTDAMSDPQAEAHQHSVTTVFPRIAETGTVDAVIAALEARA